MQPVTVIEGIAAPLLRENIDTDTIIASRDITSPSRDGFGPKLFAPWRYLGPGLAENPDFVLNRAPWRQAPILVTGTNFGCGSSREMAVWALLQYGIRCVIAPSFGAIFRNNAIRNALLPVELPGAVVAAIAAQAEQGALRLTVDLPAGLVLLPDGTRHAFTLEEQDREMLLTGLDAIDRSWRWREDIEAFEAADRLLRPWIW